MAAMDSDFQCQIYMAGHRHTASIRIGRTAACEGTLLVLLGSLVPRAFLQLQCSLPVKILRTTFHFTFSETGEKKVDKK